MSTVPNTESELTSFLQAAKRHGVSDDFVVKMLRENGWSERRIIQAYSSFYADVLGMPFPGGRRAPEQARSAFMYLLNFITLGFWSVALGQIFYTLIAHWLPDPTQSAYYSGSLQEQIAWQAATVIVAFPIFLYLHNLIHRDLRSAPDLYDSGVRRWLTYIALVFAAVVVISDGIWFIEALIQGELTARFLLDSLVLLVLGGGIFTYYLRTMEPAIRG